LHHGIDLGLACNVVGQTAWHRCWAAKVEAGVVREAAAWVKRQLELRLQLEKDHLLCHP